VTRKRQLVPQPFNHLQEAVAVHVGYRERAQAAGYGEPDGSGVASPASLPSDSGSPLDEEEAAEE